MEGEFQLDGRSAEWENAALTGGDIKMVPNFLTKKVTLVVPSWISLIIVLGSIGLIVWFIKAPMQRDIVIYITSVIALCHRSNREKEIIGEINDDILAYQTKYGNLLFVVYDVGHIRDTDRFVNSFEEHQNVMVHVVKH